MLIINWNEFLQPYEQVVAEIKLKLENVAAQYEIAHKHCPIEQIDGRVKSVSSILEKANRKGVPLEELGNKIEDIAGIRIICRFVEDIEKIVDMIREREGFDMKIVAERDYINNTKASGYRSFHLIVEYPIVTFRGREDLKAEIQIRTMSMNFWATIEHSMRYKYNGNIPEHVQERLISSAEAAFQLDREMSNIRDEIMEAQKITLIINSTVNEILSNLQKLYNLAEMEKVNELNREFIETYQLNDVDKLLTFREKVKVMADIYKVRY
ncbi:GTP pyrophosphokinase family protein [Tyzzerella sp. OttesenSCG-928-J15]|nr:GTP pyrophosphokinase family protein [Tyzzerella sp. OttesenSCG-928-J15]